LANFCNLQKKLPKQNNRPLGENLPNLVTLSRASLVNTRYPWLKIAFAVDIDATRHIFESCAPIFLTVHIREKEISDDKILTTSLCHRIP
jgi:hypothetical protein